MVKNTLCSLILLVGMATNAIADEIALRPDHPDRYVVVKGDTLWDISARFLATPWRWPEVWSFNPQIKNPHLIYPGDVVSLVYDEFGKPMLKVERGQPTVKLSPKVRAERVDKPIDTIPLNSIAQFLGQPRVITEREINNAAYVVAGTENRIIAGEGDIVYARGIVTGGDANFTILRIGQPYRNPGASRGDILGYEAIHVADAKVEVFGDPSTVHITQATREVLLGDRLVPKREYGLDDTFVPHAPESMIEGQIISVVDGVSVIGQYQTIVINKGEQDGLENGHVLAVYQTGIKVRDSRGLHNAETITLPDSKAGILLVIRTFDRVSYALVMEATRAMRIHDYVRNPS
ncbi:LysM peptidoglycan-binding domain-containing protein [Kaarinaea lacus]